MDLGPQGSGRRTAHEFVRETLRHAILTGRLTSGQRLVQADLADQLQVSTTPVREALRDLATEGLIRLDAHRGAVVQELSTSDVGEIYAIRRLLEPEIIRLAVERMSDDELEEAAAIQAEAETTSDPARWTQLNRRFHGVFSRAARAPRLAGIVDTLQDGATIHIVTSLVHGRREKTRANAQHRELVEAVRQRDQVRARAVMLAHIDETLDSIPHLEAPDPV